MREEEKREKNSLLATEISVARERERDAQEEYEEEERVREEENFFLFFLSLSPSLLGAGNAVAGAVVGEDASGADMAETWLPRPVSSCRGVHVAASCAR